jgi:hypothetical protein
MKRDSDFVQRATLICAALLGGALGCSSRGGVTDENVAVTTQKLTGGGLSSAPLKLTVSKNACAANTAQDYFNVLNAGTTGTKLSDITIKYWINDTSGSTIAPHIFFGGCITTATGSCTHPVTGVSITATPFTACGPDSTHRANWEITVSTTDPTIVPAGSSWAGVQTGVNLSNFANFVPGSTSWYSACGTGQPFVADPHFGVAFQGNLVSTGGLAAPTCRAPHGSQQLGGYLNKLGIVNAPIVGLVPPETKMGMTLALPLKSQNAAGQSLDTFIKAVSDPSSPQYHQYLTPATFATSFGPSSADYQAVIAWATAAGLTIAQKYVNNSLLYVTGTAGAIDNALFSNLVQRTRPDGTIFHSLDREPSLTLPVKLLRISGLDNLVLPKPAANFDCPKSVAGDPIQNGSGDQGGFIGSDFRNFYAACTSLNGGGAFPQTIGLFELDNFDQLDVDQYLLRAGLPPKTIGHVNAHADGDTYQAVNGPEEVALDIDVAAAMAPGATIMVFGGLGPSSNEFQNGVLGLMTEAVPLPLTLSASWFYSADDETTQLVAQFAAQGQSFFMASGDDGKYQDDPEDARDLPYTTLVGATVVASSKPGGTIDSETGWNGSGGGLFLGTEGVLGIGHVDPVGLPDYQRGIVSSPVAGVQPDRRNAPDLSMLGNNAQIFRGCKVVVVNGINAGINCGPVQLACGTSESAPLLAAFAALTNQRAAATGVGPLGFVNPVLYAIEKNSVVYGSSFNDIVVGNNGNPAAPGFDLVTGIGSPKCALIEQLASKTPTQPITSNPPPPPLCSSAKINLSASAGQLFGRGPTFCGTGTGFTPGANVSIKYIGVPGGQAAQQTRIGTADASGALHFNDTSQMNAESPVACTPAQLNGFVSVVVTDETSGCTVNQLVVPGLWCPNANVAQIGNGC